MKQSNSQAVNLDDGSIHFKYTENVHNKQKTLNPLHNISYEAEQHPGCNYLNITYLNEKGIY